MTRKALWVVVLASFAAVVAAAAWLLATESGLRWAYARLQAAVPGTLALEGLNGTLAGPLAIDGLRYESDRVDAYIDAARVDWSPSALLLGRLQIDALAVEGARIVLKETEKDAAGDAEPFSLPLNLRVADLRLQDIRIERPGQESYVVRSVELAGHVGQQIARIDRLRIDAQYLSATAEGTLGISSGTERQLQIAWRLALPDQPAVAGAGTVSGNLTALRLDQDIVEPIAATVRAEIRQPLDELRWELNVDVPAFDPARLGLEGVAREARATLDAGGNRDRFQASGTLDVRAADLPPLAGRFRLNGAATGEVVLEQLTLRVPNTDMQLTAQGRWQAQQSEWQTTVDWQNLRWPLTGDALVTSPQGTLQAGGTLQHYDLQLQAVTVGEELPRARWNITGNGDRSHIVLPDITVQALGTDFRGNAGAAWSPQLQWQAQLSAGSINPAVQWPQWPGALALQASGSGDRDTVRVRIAKLAGTLRGHRFSAEATAVRRDTSFPALALRLQAGSAKASIDGRLDERWNLAWRIDARRLGELIPDASGAMSGSGRVTGARAAPRIEAQLTSPALGYQTTRLENAALDMAVDLSDRTPSRISVRAGTGMLYGRALESAALTADGRLSSHTIAVDLQSPGPSLRARLTGAYADKTWNGTLQQSTLQLGDVAWKLAGTPGLLIRPNRAALGEACWLASAARLCLEVEHADKAGTTFAAIAQNVPLALFRPVLPEAVEVNGTLNGRAQVRLAAGRIVRADARFEAAPGTLHVAAPAKTAFAYEKASLLFTVTDSGLHAEAGLALANGDGGTAVLELPQFHTGADLTGQPLRGHLALRFRDLTPIDAVLPQIDALRGSLSAELAFTGTLADPRIRGEATLAVAAATIPAIGTRVQNLRIRAAARGGDEIEINGEAHAGGGMLGLSGRVSFPQGPRWRAELRIAGSQFLAVDLPDTQVYVSPDLSAHVTPSAIRVTGQVRIPRATFALRQSPRGVVTASPDVVIVNAPEPVETKEPWRISAEVRVILGDDVTFNGFGLSAKISGDVLLVDAPAQATTARGELRVAQGEYEAYGQKLQVERGRLVFVGGPVDNPGIDARAVRRVDSVTVGVEVKGTLRSPELSLFSDPAMAQADALSYLLFGRPLESASTSEGRSLAAAARALKLAGGERLAQRIGARFGIEEVDIETGSTPESAALVLGKQLSPRLYINYSIGLFEPENVLRLRYQLTPNWSLEAQSGKSSGGDLLFTIER